MKQWVANGIGAGLNLETRQRMRNQKQRRVMFIRRLGQKAVQQNCAGGYYCPQVLEMTDGDFAAAGLDITAEAKAKLPPGPGISPEEGVVKIPRSVMLSAVADILAAS